MVTHLSRAGVTLLELLLVLALLAAGAALVPPSLRLREDQSRASFADSLVILATSTRTMALERRTPATLAIDPETGAWWRSLDQTGVDHGQWSLSGGRLLGAEDRIELRFAPNGQVWSPTRLRFLQGGDTMTLAVDPWTGRLSVQ